jgi:hypothetical protein
MLMYVFFPYATHVFDGKNRANDDGTFDPICMCCYSPDLLRRDNVIEMPEPWTEEELEKLLSWRVGMHAENLIPHPTQEATAQAQAREPEIRLLASSTWDQRPWKWMLPGITRPWHHHYRWCSMKPRRTASIYPTGLASTMPMWGDYRCPFGKCQMERMIVAASVLLLSGLLSACTSSQPSQSNPPQPSQPAPSQPVQSNPEPKAEARSPERQAYEKAVDDYNHFIDHPKGKASERGPELCYLSAQVISTAVKDPQLAADVNELGEIKEWRRWTEIRKYALDCDRYAN